MKGIIDLHFVDKYPIATIQIAHIESVCRTKYLSMPARSSCIIQGDVVLFAATNCQTSLML